MQQTRKSKPSPRTKPPRSSVTIPFSSLTSATYGNCSVRARFPVRFMPVEAFNPYWDRLGKTFEDPDGYRIVLQNAAWG